MLHGGSSLVTIEVFHVDYWEVLHLTSLCGGYFSFLNVCFVRGSWILLCILCVCVLCVGFGFWGGNL